VSRVSPLLATTRAALVAKVWLALAFSAGCLQSAYVLSEPDGSGAGGANVGGASAGTSTLGGEAGAGGNDVPHAGSPGCDEAFRGGLDLAVCTARYWGSSGNDRLSAVALTADGEAIVGGQSEVAEWGVLTLEVASGNGVVARMNPITAEAISVARVGSDVPDLAVMTDRIVVATDWGVLALSLDLSSSLAESPLGPVARVAAAGSYVGILTSDSRALLLDDDLNLMQELSLVDRSPQDIAVDEAGVMAVTGFQAPISGGACLGSMPFIDTYDSSGALLWNAYGFADAPGWCASSQGKRLAMQNGQLYYAGEQEGGNSVHQRDPRDLSLQAPLVSYDTFSTSAGKAIDVYSFVARFDLATGTLQTGQVVVPRDAEGVGGTLFSSTLAVDESSRIFLGGRVSCCLEQRDERTIAGQSVGPFAGEEPSLLILSPDLRQRLTWTTFSETGTAAANVESIAVGNGLALLVATTSDAGSLIVHPPGVSSMHGANDGYLVTFPAP
jgi:hypothetical protein